MQTLFRRLDIFLNRGANRDSSHGWLTATEHEDPGFWHFLNTTADYFLATYKSQLQLLAHFCLSFENKVGGPEHPLVFNQLSRGLGKQFNKSVIKSQDKALYQGKSFPRLMKICPQLPTLKPRSYNSLWADTLSVPPSHA